MSGRDVLVRERRDFGALACMFNRHRANVAASVQVEGRILVEIPCLRDFGLPELDVKSVRVLKVLDSHGSNDRSKKALCTVSPSGSKTTRKYLPSRSHQTSHS